MAKKPAWSGVFPAFTTQFRADFSLDMDATRKVVSALVEEGVSGLIAVGTVGENNALSRAEKLAVMEMAKDVAGNRIPVLAGVAEYTTALACEVAKEAERLRLDGLMVLPAMVYSAKPRETLAHFRTVAAASDLPIMIYNNPPLYKTDVTPQMLATLADVETIASIKESTGDTRRFVDLRNMTGDRFIPFCGLDDVVLESIALGAQGWVSGLSNVFPREGEALFRLAASGKIAEALPLYDWFMPLLHLDARSDLVQCIKLCEEIAGRGSSITRPPRLPLDAEEKAEIERLMRDAMAKRPKLSDLGLSRAA